MRSDEDRRALDAALTISCEEVEAELTAFIGEHVAKLEREGVVLGLSGGIDSAVTAVLCVKAVGAEKVLALMMPEKDGGKEHMADAAWYGGELGIEARWVDLGGALDALGSRELMPVMERLPLGRRVKGWLAQTATREHVRITGETPFLASMPGLKGKRYARQLAPFNASYRLTHRLRMVALYVHGERENRLVVGAANRSEEAIGFFVKHGCDGVADIMPLLSLYKRQVRELARHLGVPGRIMEKAPSPGFVANITDEDTMGVTYEELDFILSGMEKGWEEGRIAAAAGVEETKVRIVREMIQRSAHKRTVYVPGRE